MYVTTPSPRAVHSNLARYEPASSRASRALRSSASAGGAPGAGVSAGAGVAVGNGVAVGAGVGGGSPPPHPKTKSANSPERTLPLTLPPL